MGSKGSPSLPAIQTPPAYDPSADAELQALKASMLTSQEAPATPDLPDMLQRQEVDWSSKRAAIQDKLRSGLSEGYQRRTYGNSILTDRPKFNPEDEESTKGLLRS